MRSRRKVLSLDEKLSAYKAVMAGAKTADLVARFGVGTRTASRLRALCLAVDFPLAAETLKAFRPGQKAKPHWKGNGKP